MEKTIKQQKECHIKVGDVEISTLESIEVAYSYMIELIKNTNVKQYLKNYEQKKIQKEVGYTG